MHDSPLDPDQELLWRALMRVTTSLPRALEDDLLHSAGLSLTEYFVLMHLSEASGQQLRMSDLAVAATLSPSRITRIVDNLRQRNLVTKRRCDADGRSTIAHLAPAGLRRLREAYPDHLASARNRVFAHLDTADARSMADLLTRIAAGTEK
jgi:DNA-binding MarR family transcriptional regulator